MTRYKVNITGKIRKGKRRLIDNIPDYNVGDILDIYVSGIRHGTWLVVKSDRLPACIECPMRKNVLKFGEGCPCYVSVTNFLLCYKGSVKAGNLMKFVDIENIM